MAQGGIVQMISADRWKRTKAEMTSRRAVHRQATVPSLHDFEKTTDW